MDQNGNKEWDLNPGIYFDERGTQLQQTDDDGYIITGWRGNSVTNLGIYLVKISKDGQIEWARTFGNTGEIPGSVRQTQDGGYVVIASTDKEGSSDVYLIKTDPEGSVE